MQSPLDGRGRGGRRIAEDEREAARRGIGTEGRDARRGRRRRRMAKQSRGRPAVAGDGDGAGGAAAREGAAAKTRTGDERAFEPRRERRLCRARPAAEQANGEFEPEDSAEGELVGAAPGRRMAAPSRASAGAAGAAGAAAGAIAATAKAPRKDVRHSHDREPREQPDFTPAGERRRRTDRRRSAARAVRTGRPAHPNADAGTARARARAAPRRRSPCAALAARRRRAGARRCARPRRFAIGADTAPVAPRARTASRRRRAGDRRRAPSKQPSRGAPAGGAASCSAARIEAATHPAGRAEDLDEKPLGRARRARDGRRVRPQGHRLAISRCASTRRGCSAATRSSCCTAAATPRSRPRCPTSSATRSTCCASRARAGTWRPSSRPACRRCGSSRCASCARATR